MTIKQPEQLWACCLQYIKDNIGDSSFNTWFKPSRFHSFDGEKLRIEVPTEFFCEYWDSHFADITISGIRKFFGQSTKLHYIIGIAEEQQNIASSPQHISEMQRQLGVFGATDFIEGLAPRHPQELNPDLNPLYTFENFIEGDSNRFPCKIAQTIADKFQDTFNPFFIYGPSGVGKTHLANAIGHRMKAKEPQKRVLYVSAHLFSVQLSQAVVKKQFNDFMSFYQSIDTLIIDDIQEIAGKTKTQEAFFNIFNHLQHNRRQLVITCDRPPVMLEGMQERILDRFNWGLIAELERPDAKLRKAIVEKRVRQNDLPFPKNVINYIAGNVTGSIRELEGIINSLLAFSVANNCEINMDLAQKTVARTVRINHEPVTPEDIVEKVGKHLKITAKDIASSSRKSHVVEARQIAMFLCQKYTKLSSSQIGLKIGKRDHSTVLHSCCQTERRIQDDKLFRSQVENIERELGKR